MASVLTSERESKARELVAAHLSDRAAHGIVARMTREGVGVFIVHGHVVTLAGVGGAALDTCDCGDRLHRGATCKHLLAARLVATKPAPTPAPVPMGITGDDVAAILRRPRVEWQEEV